MEDSNNTLPDNQKKNIPKENSNMETFNQITRRDLILFKEEFLQLLKRFKSEVNTKINSEFDKCTKILEDSNNKLYDFEKDNQAFLSKLNFIEEKYEIFSKINEKTADLKNRLMTQDMYLSQCQNDISNISFKCDKIISSNLLVPGKIGKNCKFGNLKAYILNNDEVISNIYSSIDKINADFKNQIAKFEDLRDKMEKMPINIENNSQLYTNLQIDKLSQRIESDLNLANERIQSSKIENSKYVQDLINQEKILLQKIQEVKEIKNEILDDNKNSIEKTEKSNNNLSKKFDNTLNEFHSLKKKILSLSQLLIKQKTAYGNKETDENKKEIINNFNKMLLELIKEAVGDKINKKKISFKDDIAIMRKNSNIQNDDESSGIKQSYNKKISSKNLRIEITANNINANENLKAIGNIEKRNSSKSNKYNILTKSLYNNDNKNFVDLNVGSLYDNNNNKGFSKEYNKNTNENNIKVEIDKKKFVNLNIENIFNFGGSSKKNSENKKGNNITEETEKKNNNNNNNKNNNNDGNKKNKELNCIDKKEEAIQIKIDSNKKNKDKQDISKINSPNKYSPSKKNNQKSSSHQSIFNNNRNNNLLINSATNTNPNANNSNKNFQDKNFSQNSYQDIPKISNNFLKPKPKIDKTSLKKFIIGIDKKESLKNHIQKNQFKIMPNQESIIDNEHHYVCKTENSKRPSSISLTRTVKNNVDNNLLEMKYKKKNDYNEIYLDRDIINNMSYYKDQDIIDKPLLSNNANFELINSSGNLEQKIIELEYFTKKKFDELVSEIKNFIPIHFNSHIKDYVIKNKERLSRY